MFTCGTDDGDGNNDDDNDDSSVAKDAIDGGSGGHGAIAAQDVVRDYFESYDAISTEKMVATVFVAIARMC